MANGKSLFIRTPSGIIRYDNNFDDDQMYNLNYLALLGVRGSAENIEDIKAGEEVKDGYHHKYWTISKADIGLGLADNTRDTDKNVATARTLYTGRDFTLGLTTKNFNGSRDLSWTLAEIGALPAAGGTATGDYTRSNIASGNIALSLSGVSNNTKGINISGLGIGIDLTVPANSKGINVTNSNSGYGLYLTASNAGLPIRIDKTGTNQAIYVYNDSATNGVYINTTGEIVQNSNYAVTGGEVYRYNAATYLPLAGGTISGNLSVAGDETVSGSLDVTGVATLSSLAVVRNSAIGGTLSVTGDTTLTNLTTSGNVSIGGTLNMTGNTTLSGLSVNGDADISGTLNANSINIKSGATIHTNFSVVTTLYGSATPRFEVQSATINMHVPVNIGTSSNNIPISIHGNIFGYGNETLSGTLGVTGATTLSSTLSVAGKTSLSGDIEFAAVTSTTYPAISKGIKWSGSADGASIYYRVDAADAGRLVLNLTDDTNTKISFALNGTDFATIDTSGNYSGNASTASKWATARTITLTGSVTGSVSIDGSGNVSLTTTTNHTHNYAGSSSAGGAATSANKLNTNAGDSTTPVYFSNGIPVALSYTIAKSVPSDAVFTDTKVTQTATTSSGYYPLLFSADADKTATSTTTARFNQYIQVYNKGLIMKNANGKTDVQLYSDTSFADQAAGRTVFMTLGNSSIYDTGNGSEGMIRLYGHGAYYAQVSTGSLTTHRTFTLNDTGGIIASFPGTATSGRVVVTGSTGGALSASVYTIAKSVPSDAIFTDSNVAQILDNNTYQTATYYPLLYTPDASKTATSTTFTRFNQYLQVYADHGIAMKNASGKTDVQLYMDDGFSSTGNNHFAYLRLGNSETNNTTAGASQGRILLYGSKSYAATILVSDDITASQSFALSKGGTVLTSGNYNSYAVPLSGGTMTGKLGISVSGARGLEITETGNYYGAYISQSGASSGLYISQSGNGNAININKADSTSSTAIQVTNNGTGNGIGVTNASTAGNAINIINASTYPAVYITQSGSSNALNISHSNNSNALYINKTSGTHSSLYINHTVTNQAEAAAVIISGQRDSGDNGGTALSLFQYGLSNNSLYIDHHAANNAIYINYSQAVNNYAAIYADVPSTSHYGFNTNGNIGLLGRDLGHMLGLKGDAGTIRLYSSGTTNNGYTTTWSTDVGNSFFIVFVWQWTTGNAAGMYMFMCNAGNRVTTIAAAENIVVSCTANSFSITNNGSYVARYAVYRMCAGGDA